jgi:hypothetical protein
LTRLVDPDRVLKTRIGEFVTKGEFGLASGADSAGTFRRVWFREDIDLADIAFEADVYLLAATVATRLKAPETAPTPSPPPEPSPLPPAPPSEAERAARNPSFQSPRTDQRQRDDAPRAMEPSWHAVAPKDADYRERDRGGSA